MAAVQVLEAQHGVGGLGRGGRQRRMAGGGRHIAPEAAHAQAQGQHGKQEHLGANRPTSRLCGKMP